MRHDSLVCHMRLMAWAGCWAGLLAALAATPCGAQAPATLATPTAPPTAAPPALSADDAAALARLTVAIAEVRDSAQKQLSLGRNKTPQAQQQLRQQAVAQVAALLQQAKLTEAEYRRRTYLVSTDSTARRAYDAAVARLTSADSAGAPGAPMAAPAAPR